MRAAQLHPEPLEPLTSVVSDQALQGDEVHELPRVVRGVEERPTLVGDLPRGVEVAVEVREVPARSRIGPSAASPSGEPGERLAGDVEVAGEGGRPGQPCPDQPVLGAGASPRPPPGTPRRPRGRRAREQVASTGEQARQLVGTGVVADGVDHAEPVAVGTQRTGGLDGTERVGHGPRAAPPRRTGAPSVRAAVSASAAATSRRASTCSRRDRLKQGVAHECVPEPVAGLRGSTTPAESAASRSRTSDPRRRRTRRSARRW